MVWTAGLVDPTRKAWANLGARAMVTKGGVGSVWFGCWWDVCALGGVCSFTEWGGERYVGGYRQLRWVYICPPTCSLYTSVFSLYIYYYCRYDVGVYIM